MHGYRAYTIGPDGHVVGRMGLFCSSDDDAKERAKQLVDGHAVELWGGARKIAILSRITARNENAHRVPGTRA